MINTIKKIYILLTQKRKRQLLCLTLGMFVLGFVELGLAGAIALLGVGLAAPERLEKIVLFNIFSELLPSFGADIPQAIRMLLLVLGLIFIGTAAKNIMTALMTYWQGIVSQLVAWDLCVRIFDNYLYAPYVWHTQHNASDLNGYLSWRLYIASFCLGALQVASQLGIIFFLATGAFVMAPEISLLLYVTTACIAWIVYKTSQRKARETGEEIAQLNLELGKVTYSALHGIREVQIYDQQQAFKKSFCSYTTPIVLAYGRQGLYSPMPHWFLESVGILLLFGAVIFMASQKMSVASISGTLTLMAAISWRLLPALNKIVGGILQLKSNIAPVQKLLGGYLNLPRIYSRVTNNIFNQAIQLKDISFRYPDAKVESLRHVTMTIPKRSMIGLIGLSGAGKSTLVGILTGLLIPQHGTFQVDGKDVAPGPGFLNIGYVPQNPYILDASLAENVAFCEWGKAPDENRVRRCCAMAAVDFLDDLQNGIYTELGDRGVRLSGGQMQRVAIARALYCNPDILLFDEATSALDGATEKAIQNTILSLRQSLTIIIVAHRLTTVQDCDNLYWINNGELLAHGSVSNVMRDYEKFLKNILK